MIAGIALALLAQTAAPLKLMPVGDSITETNTGHASWRYWLDHTLHDEGVAFDFVGSLSGVFGGPPLYPDFDQDHEAHSGWQTAEMSLAIESLATTAAPDVALIHLGNTDINHAVPVTTALVNLQSIVLNLRAARPNATMLVAQIVPIELAGQVPPALTAYNSQIPVLIATVDRPESRVLLVDQFTGYDSTLDTYDGFHPDESGEQKIAARWNAKLLPVFDVLVPPTFSPGDELEVAPIDASDEFDATFDAVLGMKIDLALKATTAAGKSMHATVAVIDPNGLAVGSKALNFAKGGHLALELAATGRHHLHLSGFTGGLGPIAITTSRTLPKSARLVKKTFKIAAAATGLQLHVRALPNARLYATIDLPAGAAAPAVLLLTPDGATLDLADFSILNTKGDLDLVDVPLFFPGDYYVDIGGLQASSAPVKVKTLLDPKQPKKGNSTVQLTPLPR